MTLLKNVRLNQLNKAIAEAKALKLRNFSNSRAATILFEQPWTTDNYTDVHSYLSKARAELWDSYLSSPSIRNKDRGLLIETIFKAVARQSAILINGEALPLSNKGWSKLNEDLINEIHKEMALAGFQKLK